MNVVCKALQRRHVDSWSVAGVIASYVYKAPRGHQRRRTDGKITAAEFERQIAEALASDPTYKGIPPMSDTTVGRFLEVWALAARDGIVPAADEIAAGQVPPTRHITADFDEYLNVVRPRQTKTKQYQPVSDEDELAAYVRRFERVVEAVEQSVLYSAFQDEASGLHMDINDFPDLTARMTDVLSAVRTIGQMFGVSDSVAPGPKGKLDTWASRMFAALPARLHQPAYKALSRVLHPDAGGDEEAMKLVNDAYDRRGK